MKRRFCCALFGAKTEFGHLRRARPAFARPHHPACQFFPRSNNLPVLITQRFPIVHSTTTAVQPIQLGFWILDVTDESPTTNIQSQMSKTK
jgi:hypothetical protein